MKRIYLDYAASTPIDPRVKAAMEPYFSKIYGNAGSLHSFGQEASAAIFKAKETIARSIGASYRDIIFTGSATEANNLAIRGVLKAIQNIRIPSELSEKNYSKHSDKFVGSDYMPRVITSAIEHESVLETCRDLEKEGVEVVYIPISKEGIIDLKKLKAALNERTVLVSIMHANNEIGTIQPIFEIAKIISDFKKQSAKRKAQSVNDSRFAIRPWPLLHTDAVQSFQYLDCNVQNLGVDPVRGREGSQRASASNGVDLMTLSAHKIYGPKGIGVLYAKFSNGRYPLAPLITGGNQQQGIRPGTENTPLAVGFAKAVELAVKMREKESRRVQILRDYFWKNLKKKLPKIAVNGSMTHRLPNNLNIYFPGNPAQDLLIKLDLAGIAVSPGAACLSHVAQSSYVLEALGWPLKRSSGSLRFSFGRQTTKQELDQTLDIIAKVA